MEVSEYNQMHERIIGRARAYMIAHDEFQGDDVFFYALVGGQSWREYMELIGEGVDGTSSARNDHLA